MSSPVYQQQPFKSVYLLYEALRIAFVQTPLWIWYALPRDKRPRPSWSLNRVVRVNLLKHRPYVVAKTGMWWREPTYLALEQGTHVKGVWISPTPHLIVGDVKEWATSANVESIRIPGYWIEKQGSDIPVGSPPKPGEKVLYVLHGGGYARLSGHPDDETSNIPRGILKHTGPQLQRALSLEYRLTQNPSEKPYHPFPAALLDAIAGYSYLVNDVGFAPEDVIVEGDSAGGHLALALVRYLIENQSHTGVTLPRVPGALILASPWVDLGPASNDRSASVQANIPSDYLNVANRGTRILVQNFCGPLGPAAAVTNRYISPASTASTMEPVSFKGFPRTFVVAGGAEVMTDQIRTLRSKMEADLGSGLVKYVEMPDAIHDFLVYLWHDPERTECLRMVGKWIESEHETAESSACEGQYYYVPKSKL